MQAPHSEPARPGRVVPFKTVLQDTEQSFEADWNDLAKVLWAFLIQQPAVLENVEETMMASQGNCIPLSVEANIAIFVLYHFLTPF
jgi:hypothetical protein